MLAQLRRPPGVAIVLAAGIALAPLLDRAGWPAAASGTLALTCAGLAARFSQVGALAVVAVLAFGASRGSRPPIDLAGVDDRVLDRVVGDVRGPIVASAGGHGALLETVGAPVWLWTTEPLVPGERVAATGYLVTARGPRGFAQPDREAALASRGARLELIARSLERIADEPDLTARAWRIAGEVQTRAAARIREAGGDRDGSRALAGIAIGDRSEVPPELDARWRTVGIFHALSVSGFHLAIVAMLVFGLARRAIAASPWGGRVRPACWAGPPTLAIAAAYTMVTGGQIATIRALVVVAIVVVAAMIDRPIALVDALGIAAIAILAWRPADLHDPGFQLSFAATLVLAVVARERVAWSRHEARRWLIAQLRAGLRTSMWITLATSPITAYHFHQVTPGGVVGNLVLGLPLELLALPLALAGLVLHWDAPVWLASWIVGLVDRGAGALAEVVPLGRVALASPVVMVVLVVIAIALAARARQGPRTTRDAVLALATCLGWALGRAPPPAGALRVTFVDVGQGDAAVIELPTGAVWLIDAGGHASARELAAGAAPGRAITRVLAAAGHDRVDLAIVSHPHPDHYLGFAGLDVPVDELWTAPEEAASPTSSEFAFASIVDRLHTTVRAPPLGVARRDGDVELIAWAPRYAARDGDPPVLAADPVRSVNDNSLVVAVRYAGRTLLFTGDVEAEGEAALIAAGVGPVDVVKVPHHGSPTSSSRAFVEATHPALAVISCGRANAFGFPSPTVVARWRAAGAEVARTDTDGTIVVTVAEDGGLAIRSGSP